MRKFRQINQKIAEAKREEASRPSGVSMRLQKALSQYGYASRRDSEKWIASGRVTINGVVAVLGAQVKKGDKIAVDGRVLPIYVGEKVATRVLLYNKPPGEVSTRRDEQDRPTVFDTLPRVREGRWVMVGRLDVNTAGLMLFTNDGEFANCLMHPSSEIEREYSVRVIRELSPETLEALKTGVILEDGPAAFSDIAPIGGDGMNRWYRVILKEGRYREVRRLFAHFDITVNRLIRVRYGTVCLPRDLRVGEHRELAAASLQQLAELANYRAIS